MFFELFVEVSTGSAENFLTVGFSSCCPAFLSLELFFVVSTGSGANLLGGAEGAIVMVGKVIEH